MNAALPAKIMKPVEFQGHNTIFAKDQPQYLPLPAHRSQDGMVTTCWRLTFWERLAVLFTGVLWLQQLTFNARLQPQRATVESPLAGK